MKVSPELTIKMSDRFRIRGLLGKGTYGQVYHGEDLQNRNPICVKVNFHNKINQLEYNALKDLNNAGFENFPKVHGHGIAKNQSFIVM